MGGGLFATPLYRYQSLNMFDKSKLNIIKQFLFPLVFSELLGFAFIGDYIFYPNNTLFTFTVFGFSAILFYNLLSLKNLRDFILISILYTFLVIAILFSNSDLLKILKNISWFISIGILSFIISRIEHKSWYKNNNAWLIVSWFLGFVLVYIFMTLQNIYVYQFYPLDANYDLLYYIKQSIKIGSLIGLGIGFGFYLINTDRFVKRIKTV